MCGICGVYYFDAARAVDAFVLQQMASLLAHRGPDGEGLALLGQVGLAHRRLKVIDLATGDQPMFNEDRSIALVFNGEIYNFRSLRRELQSLGHVFSSRSDTEVIVHAYEEYGVRCLDRFRGMFAFALWDGQKRALFLARDRVGKKPLYYCCHDGALWFASELKALLAIEGIRRRLVPQAVHHFLTYQYVPPPGTMFNGIYKLPHAHFIFCENGEPKPQRYWHLEYKPKLDVSESEALKRCDALIDEAVALRLESDVPLGVFLSGGIDSSLVVAMMRRHVSGPLRTFSIGFEHERYNELPYARQVAQRYETDHEELMVRVDAAAALPKLVWHFDEPFADMAALPTFYLSQMTRRYVTVALNGDGGDESFAGYDRYLGWFPGFRRWQRVPDPLRRYVAAPAIGGLERLFSGSWFVRQLRYVNDTSLADPAFRYVQMLALFRDWMKGRLYTPEFASAAGPASSLEWMMEHYVRSDLESPLDRMLNTDIMTYLPEDLLPKVDRTTMAFGLEGRSPLLDQELMAYAARLPDNLKVRGGTLKYLLRRIAEPLLPPELVWRTKHGFSTPIGAWLRDGLRPLCRETILSECSLSRGFFKRRELETLIREHESGLWNHGGRLWALMSLEVWCRTFLDRQDIMSGPISL
jgi:asparagine synthase (glutamine-hydrolysing)